MIPVVDAARRDQVQTALLERAERLSIQCDPAAIVSAFEALPASAPYQHVPAAVSAEWERVAAYAGEDGLFVLQGLTMLRLMDDFEHHQGALRLTDEIRICFGLSFTRILDALAQGQCASYWRSTDNLLKDLGICRHRLIPAGARVLDPKAGFPRSLLLRSGVGQVLKGLRVLMQGGGNEPYLESHVHLLQLDEVNAQGWQHYLRRVAALLELNPHLRGLFGCCWLYDPALAEVSPRLAYHLALPLEHGATLLYSHVDVDGGALVRSETRRRLHREGRYLPRAYALIWPRDAMLRWFRGQARPPVDSL